jgi:hypothetical protein
MLDDAIPKYGAAMPLSENADPPVRRYADTFSPAPVRRPADTLPQPYADAFA